MTGGRVRAAPGNERGTQPNPWTSVPAVVQRVTLHVGRLLQALKAASSVARQTCSHGDAVVVVVVVGGATVVVVVALGLTVTVVVEPAPGLAAVVVVVVVTDGAIVNGFGTQLYVNRVHWRTSQNRRSHRALTSCWPRHPLKHVFGPGSTDGGCVGTPGMPELMAVHT